MPIVEGVEKLFSLTARKRFGKHRFFGSCLLGHTGFGTDDMVVRVGKDKDVTLTGIYSKKHLNNKVFYTRGRYYIPYNPRTEKQQVNRSKVANAVLAWQNLTNEQKAVYNKRAIRENFYGYSLFIREYLLSH